MLIVRGCGAGSRSWEWYQLMLMQSCWVLFCFRSDTPGPHAHNARLRSLIPDILLIDPS